MDTILISISALAVCLYLFCAVKFQLQMLQQSSYYNKRYLLWLQVNYKQKALIYAVLAVVMALSSCFWLNIALFMLLALLAAAELRRKSKKPLVFTARVKRLFASSFLLTAIITILSAIFVSSSLMAVLKTVAVISLCSVAVVLLANILLAPVERAINNWYINDARRILASMPNLKIIGITGSYGKTSTKYFLYNMLYQRYNTLMTPGSYNTTLGVVRTIREQLKPYHEVFIVEMGAKAIGDIAQICDIVHPEMAILTSVGPQHLESFKSIENVKRAKFELIDALPQGGFAVLNNDFQPIADNVVTGVDNVVRYSTSGNGNLLLEDVTYSSKGTSFTIASGENWYDFTTKILGRHNISNIMAGYAIASHLGVDYSHIKMAVDRLEPVEHRLSLRHVAGGVTIIDDAFNSNPQGAAMALEVLGSFAPLTRIIVTPGLIELGERQYSENKAFGKAIASSASYAIVVGSYNSEAIKDGLEEGGFDMNNLFLASTLTKGVEHLSSKFSSKGYVVLYENDLPDTFK